jgi:N-acetylneuraminic acid mutarotase
MGISLSKSVALLLVLVLLVAPCIISVKPAWAAVGSWTTMAPIPTARRGLGVAVVDGKIYAIGGRNDWISPYLGTNEMYDPATDTWTSKAPMPTPRREFAIAVYGNKIYCIGGETDDVTTGINEVYDTETDTWETMTAMPTARHGMDANVVGGMIYVISGGQRFDIYPYYSCSGKNEVYDPKKDTWTEKASIPTGRIRAASAVVDDRIYILGGQAGLFVGGWYDFNQVYDTKNDSWTTAAPVPVGFDAASAAATTGVFAPKRIYVFGGFTEASYTPQNLTQVYNPESDSWSSGVPMLTPHASFDVAVVNDELYVISGSQANMKPPSVENEKYTPVGYGVSDFSSSPSPSPSSSTPELQQPEPFPLTWIIAAIAIVATGGVASAIYFFIKRRKTIGA